MDAIEKIVEQILEKGNKEILSISVVEKERIQQNFSEELSDIQLKEEKQIKKDVKQLASVKKQKQLRQQSEIRQMLMKRKQKWLDQLFEEAVKEVQAWGAEQFLEFSAEVLKNISLTGKINIMLGEQSKELITQEWLDQFSQENKKFVLSSSFLSNESGFVAEQDGVEYNFLFRTMIEEVQQQESYSIAETLFN